MYFYFYFIDQFLVSFVGCPNVKCSFFRHVRIVIFKTPKDKLNVAISNSKIVFDPVFISIVYSSYLEFIELHHSIYLSVFFQYCKSKHRLWANKRFIEESSKGILLHHFPPLTYTVYKQSDLNCIFNHNRRVRGNILYFNINQN